MGNSYISQPDVSIASGFYSYKIQEKNETIMGSLENGVYLRSTGFK